MQTMKAVVMDRFGGPEVLRLGALPVPELGPRDVLIRVEYAGVGEWDAFEREGGYAALTGIEPRFPYVLGSEGAGTVARVGPEVRAFREGDRVHGIGFLNPRGGFYAEYVALDAGLVAAVPGRLGAQQAAAMGGAGLTALRGIVDTLALGAGESIAIVGASGGVGHLAVQVAKHAGARVLAVASGADGVSLVRALGADGAVDGRRDDVPAAARALAPDGLYAALLLAGGGAAARALGAVREGGRAAYANGVRPVPEERAGVRLTAYNGEPDPDVLRRWSAFVETGAPVIHVSGTFALADAALAQRAAAGHHLGKLVLRVS